MQKVTDFEVGWLAGLIDGDGTISVYVRQPSPHHKSRAGAIIPHITITNCNPDLVECLHDLLNRIGVGHHIVWRKAERHYPSEGGHPIKRREDIAHISMHGMKRVEKALDVVGNFLIGKKPQALLVREFIRYRKDPKTSAIPTARAIMTPYGDYEWELVEKIRSCQKGGKTNPDRKFWK